MRSRILLLVSFMIGVLYRANAQNLIAVQVTTDQYGAETIWQIDGQGGAFFANGSGYPDQAQPGSYPQPDQTVDLSDGTFSFCTSSLNTVCAAPTAMVSSGWCMWQAAPCCSRPIPPSRTTSSAHSW